jgi:hypothetical protein
MEADEQHFKNQQEFRGLLEKHGLTQAQAAELIKKTTKRSVTTRTVRRWLAPETAKSTVTCTEWAVDSLRKAIAETVANGAENKP